MNAPVTVNRPPNGSATASPASSAWFVKVWIWLCALAGLAGWTLSAFGQLNCTGYAVFFGAVALIFLKFGPWREWRRLNLRKSLRRLRRPLPGAFAGLTFLVLLGGILHAPTSFTGLNYHLGRVLQWTSHGRWLWIHTPMVRMNFSGCAFEWLTTPLVLFTRSDRFLFIVNFISFLLLPGLIFGVFTRLGVRSRVAWHWMWLLPSGYIFLLQAGSIANDSFSSVFTLAAIYFACIAWKSRNVQDLWLSLLSAALLTGAKPTNLPLLLPWFILILPLAPLFFRRWLASLAVAVLAGVASFVPIALMNFRHTGDWLGRNIESVNLEVHQPLVGIAVNAFQLVLDNLVPPIFPWAGWWNQHATSLVPPEFLATIDKNFDPGFYIVGELPTEDWTGLGFGVVLLLVVSVLGSLWLQRETRCKPAVSPVPSWLSRWVLIAAWISLLAYSMKSGMATGARLIAPYYLLLVPAFLTLCGQSFIVRRRWWRLMAGAVMVLACFVLVMSPDRPLWPAQTVLSAIAKNHPGKTSVKRALDVYALYARRNDALAGVRELLPPNYKTVGLVGDGDECDISLWRPFGSRQVNHFLLSDPPDLIRSQTKYVVVDGNYLALEHLNINDWLRTNNAELVASTNILVKLAEGPQDWYLTRFKPQ